MNKTIKIQRQLNDKDFRIMAKKNSLEIKGVKPFTRILPDSSDLQFHLSVKYLI